MYLSKRIVILIFLILSACSSATGEDNSNNTQNNTVDPNNQTFEKLNHDDFDKILSKYVDNSGQVNYKSLKSEDTKALKKYVNAIAGTSLSKFSEQEKLAFYLNAYNAIVLWKVVNKYPINSVTAKAGFFDKETQKVAGKVMTLDALENEVIRPTFKNAQVHFGLVCAAKSCPPLQQKAFRAETLDAKLDELASKFVKSQTSVEGKTVTTSKIFDWFKEDFIAKSGSVGKYLATYLPEQKALLESKDLDIKFSTYDWALNEQ